MAVDNILVITGGAGGMGLACARTLADRGRLLLLDVRGDLLDQARKALGAQGAIVDTQLCDVNGDRVEDFCYLTRGSLVWWPGRGRGSTDR